LLYLYKQLIFKLKILLLSTFLLGLMSPAIAHNEFNSDEMEEAGYGSAEPEEGEEAGIRYRGNIEK